MAIENAMLAGGAALSLLAGVFAGQYALLPAQGENAVQGMTPLHFPASASQPVSQWQDARYTAAAPVAAPAVEAVNLAEDAGIPPDPPARDDLPATPDSAGDRDTGAGPPQPDADRPGAEPTAPADPEGQPTAPPQDTPAPSRTTAG